MIRQNYKKLISIKFTNNFLKESFIYGLTGALSKFSVFITIPIYTKYLTMEEFGTLDLYLTISMILYIIFEMQMQSGFMRSYYEKKKDKRLDELLGTVLSFYFIGYSLLILIFFIFYFLDVDLIYIVSSSLLPIILTILPKQLFDLNNIIMRMEHQAKKYLIFNITYFFLIAIIGILTVVSINADVELVLWSIFIGNLVFSIISVFNMQKSIKFNLNFIHFKEVFYYSAPIVPAVLGGWAIASIGKVYITEYLSLGDLGIYSLALKVGMIYFLFVQAFTMAWQPFMIKKFEDEKSKDIFAKAMTYYVVFGLITIYIIYLCAPLIISILASDAYRDAITFVPVLLLSYFWQGAISIVAVGNSWVRKTYYNSIGTILGSIVVLITTYYLVKNVGLLGAAIGQLLGFVCSFFIIMYFAQRNKSIDYSKISLILIVAISAGVVLWSY